MLALIAVVALSLQILAPYLVWPSRWNIPTHIAAGLCMTAYIIPGLMTNLWDQYPKETVNFFILINCIGAVALCAGILIGGNITVPGRSKYTDLLTSWNSASSARLTRRVVLVTIICVIGIYLAYYIMGFIPMFADDPFSAKQFKGEYRDAYYRAAYLFRFSFSVLAAIMPLVLLVAWIRRVNYLYLLAGIAFFAILISLARSAMATGLLFFLGIVAARYRGGMRLYIPLVLVIFPFGSIFYYVLGQVLGVEQLTTGYVGDTFSDFVAAGTPDILDQLGWLHGFMKGDYFSWGRTIYGGLIPGNYMWNPAVWTLTFDNVGADISEVVSGGLRLTPAEWGYANFSWFGLIIIPFFSGLLNGAILRKLRDNIMKMNILQASAALLLYSTLGQQIVQFYFLSIHAIPAIAAALFFWYANSQEQRQTITQDPAAGGLKKSVTTIE